MQIYKNRPKKQQAKQQERVVASSMGFENVVNRMRSIMCEQEHIQVS